MPYSATQKRIIRNIRHKRVDYAVQYDGPTQREIDTSRRISRNICPEGLITPKGKNSDPGERPGEQSGRPERRS